MLEKSKTNGITNFYNNEILTINKLKVGVTNFSMKKCAHKSFDVMKFCVLLRPKLN